MTSQWKFNHSDLQWLLTCDDQYHISTWIYAAQAVLACLSAIITFSKYNSISILNLRIHIDAISNTWWIIYFIVGTLRAVLNAISFWLFGPGKGQPDTIEHLIIADWSAKALEVLTLCFALNYQRKYRSNEQINEDVDSYSKSGHTGNESSFWQYLRKATASSGAVLLAIALVTWISITLLFVFDDRKRDTSAYFWIYLACCGLFHLAMIWLSMLIVVRSAQERPSISTKIVLLVAVLLTIPIDVPAFIWHHAFTTTKCFYHLSIFDIFVVLKCCSYLFFVLAIRGEFIRLKQKCQWAMLSEVQRFSF